MRCTAQYTACECLFTLWVSSTYLHIIVLNYAYAQYFIDEYLRDFSLTCIIMLMYASFAFTKLHELVSKLINLQKYAYACFIQSFKTTRTSLRSYGIC